MQMFFVISLVWKPAYVICTAVLLIGYRILNSNSLYKL